MPRKAKDLSGMVFGEITVIKRSERFRYGSIFWDCLCSCGKALTIDGGDLRKGRKSCGCISRLIDETGNVYTSLTVLRQHNPQRGKRGKWVCQCKCGKESIVDGASLRNGTTKSCGCIKHKDLVGKRFGRLLVIARVSGGGQARFECLCDCGKTKIAFGQYLGCGWTNSCGCLRTEITKNRHRKYRESKGLDPDVSINGMKRVERTIFSDSKLRQKRFEMDDYTCALCGVRGGKMQAHHIETWIDAPDRRFDITNIVTLCKKCHFEKVHCGNNNGPVDPEITEQLRSLAGKG